MKILVQFAFVSTMKEKKFIGQNVGIFSINNAYQVGYNKNPLARSAEVRQYEVSDKLK